MSQPWLDNLILDPDDGRDLGALLARHQIADLLPPAPVRPSAAAEEIRAASDELSVQILGQLQAAVDAGLGIEVVDMRTDTRWEGDKWILSASLSYRPHLPKAALECLVAVVDNSERHA